MRSSHFIFAIIVLTTVQSARAEDPIPVENYRPVRRARSRPPPPPPQPEREYAPQPEPPRAATRRSPATEVVGEDNVNAWAPEKAGLFVGYERAGAPFGNNATTALTQNAVVFGGWLSKDIGLEGFLGFTKNDETAATVHDETGNQAGTVKTVTDTMTAGATDPLSLVLGGTLRARLVQNSWFQFYVGGLLGVCPGGKSTNDTGVRTTSFPQLDTHPQTRTVVETSVGQQTIERRTYVFVGPKLGTEFYLRWIPHLALGFSTGILTTFGGDFVTSISTKSSTQTFTDGVAGTPTGDTQQSTTTTIRQPLRATTFGVGGSNFQFNGIFTLRYIW